MKRFQRGSGDLDMYGFIFACTIAFVWYMATGPIACHARWDDTFRASWGPVKGCMIETKPGKWMPADNYREVE